MFPGFVNCIPKKYKCRVKVRKVINFIIICFARTCTGTVQIVSKLGRSEWLRTSAGMRQGSALSSVLYNGMLDGTSIKVR
jgi:hypothetical protein